MKDRLSVALLCLCALLLTLLLIRPSLLPASAQAAPLSPAGHYTIAGAGSTLYFSDTATGRVWAYVTVLSDRPQMKWVEMDTPEGKAKGRE